MSWNTVKLATVYGVLRPQEAAMWEDVIFTSRYTDFCKCGIRLLVKQISGTLMGRGGARPVSDKSKAIINKELQGFAQNGIWTTTDANLSSPVEVSWSHLVTAGQDNLQAL